MRRKAIAAAWVAGVTVPLLLATVFIFGCCVLPFHQFAHKLMPICDLAAKIMRGDDGADHHRHDAVPPAPSDRQEPVKRIATEVPDAFRLVAASAVRPLVPTATTAYRSFISLGAVRCDCDVGLHVLDDTFLI